MAWAFFEEDHGGEGLISLPWLTTTTSSKPRASGDKN